MTAADTAAVAEFRRLAADRERARDEMNATANAIAHILSIGGDPAGLVQLWADERAALVEVRLEADAAFHAAYGARADA